MELTGGETVFVGSTGPLNEVLLQTLTLIMLLYMFSQHAGMLCFGKRCRKGGGGRTYLG